MMMKSKKVNLLILLAAVIVALATRFFRLSDLPYPPNGDEIAFGYYGWSILNFGTDEYGVRFPLSFSSIGDYKYPGLSYLNVIPAAIFGLSELTTRFWPAVSGVLLVPLVYFLSMLIFSNKKASLASAWIAALSPWSLVESRYGDENHLSMVLTLLGVIALLTSLGFSKNLGLGKELIRKIEKHKRLLTITSFVFFFIAAFTYAAQRFFIPSFLFLLVALSLLKKCDLGAKKGKLVFFWIVSSIIVVFSFLPQGSRGRASEDVWQGITPGEKDRLEQLYVGAGTSSIKLPVFLTRLFHNKYRVAVFGFTQRYLEHFSPDFLFFKGESSNRRIPDMGVLLFAEIILLAMGLATFLLAKNNNRSLILLAWLLLAPVASALTTGGVHTNRASNMIPALSLISGYGFYVISTFIRGRMGKVFTVCVVLGIGFSFLYTLNQIFVQKPIDRPWFKETVNKEMVKNVYQLKNNYKAIALGDDDYIFFLFYAKISPKDFVLRSEIIPQELSKWERVNHLENIYFKMPFDCPKGGKLNVLYVCSGGEIPRNSKVIKTIYYPDHIPAYNLIEFYPISQMPVNLPDPPENVHYMVDVERNPKFPDGIIPENYSSLW